MKQARFAVTHCSQCGGSFGPGDAGFSHCKDHRQQEPQCRDCNDTGERDSGGTHPWGAPVYIACDCKDAEIGRRWREDSSLEAWFPITAQRLRELQDENERLRATARKRKKEQSE